MEGVWIGEVLAGEGASGLLEVEVVVFVDAVADG